MNLETAVEPQIDADERRCKGRFKRGPSHPAREVQAVCWSLALATGRSDARSPPGVQFSNIGPNGP